MKVVQLKAGFDSTEIFVDQSSNFVLKYRTPTFRAIATVEVPPVEAGQLIEIGWIQVCTGLKFVNQYGDVGLTSWELPELVSGLHEMISDSDGKQYPWYGGRHEVVRLKGPLKLPTPVTVYMHDCFRPQVTWYVPAPGSATGSHLNSTISRLPRLTQVRRKQNFLTYLAVIRKPLNETALPNSPLATAQPYRSNHNPTASSYELLKVISWSAEVLINVDPTKPLGQRVTCISPVCQPSPTVLDPADAPAIENSALEPPNANSCQALIWWPMPASEVTRTVTDAEGTRIADQHRKTVSLGGLPARFVVQPANTGVSNEIARKTYLNAQSRRVELLRFMIDHLHLN